MALLLAGKHVISVFFMLTCRTISMPILVSLQAVLPRSRQSLEYATGPKYLLLPIHVNLGTFIVILKDGQYS